MERKQIKHILDIDNTLLRESFKPNSRYRCIIIKSGLTKTANAHAELNGVKVPVYKNYTEEALKQAAEKGIFENVPALYRADDEHLQGSDTGVNCIVGTFTDTKWNESEKQVEGIFNLNYLLTQNIKIKKAVKQNRSFSRELISALGGISPK